MYEINYKVPGFFISRFTSAWKKFVCVFIKDMFGAETKLATIIMDCTSWNENLEKYNMLFWKVFTLYSILSQKYLQYRSLSPLQYLSKNY